MLYIAVAVLLACASLMIDIANAWGNGVKAKKSGHAPGGVSLFPGLLFFPAVGCGLAWWGESVFPGYAFWIIGTIALLAILVAFFYYIRYRCLIRDMDRREAALRLNQKDNADKTN